MEDLSSLTFKTPEPPPAPPSFQPPTQTPQSFKTSPKDSVFKLPELQKRDKARILNFFIATFSLILMLICIVKADYFTQVLSPIDHFAQDELNTQLKKAGGVFLTARGLSGIISVVTASSVSASPLGVGLDVGIGGILSPIRDLLNQFSSIMLVATGSIALQKLILKIGTGLFMQVLLPVALFIFSLSLLFLGRPRKFFSSAALKLFIFAFVIRFFIPFSCLLGTQIDKFFLNETFEQTNTQLTQVSGQLEGHNWTDFKQAKSTFMAMIQNFKMQIERLGNTLANLIAIFLIQTVLLPLFVLWGMKKMMNSLVEFRGPTQVIVSSPPEKKEK